MKKLALLDICLPDYFTGYHLPVCAIPLSGTMTNKDIADGINYEINSAWEYIFAEHTEHEQYYNEYIAELLKRPDDIFYKEIEEINEDDDCAYAYFSVINPVTRYGITFLNP